MLLNDKKVYVGRHIGKKERMSKVEEQRAQFTNIYIKNVDLEVTSDQFDELFKPFGAIVSSALSVDESGASRGFGFVNYEDHESARQAVEALHDTDFHGKKLFVSRAQKRSERDEELRRSHEEKRMEQESKSAGVNLYVKNLDGQLSSTHRKMIPADMFADEWDDDRLRAEFETFGQITSCKVMKDDKEVSRGKPTEFETSCRTLTIVKSGFGFVCFTSPDEATKAVSEMNGKIIGSKPLYVSLAQRKDVRRQALESQMAQRNTQRMQYAAANGLGGPGGYMAAAQPMYYPPMPPYGQPGMMPMGGRGPMGYPGAPQGMMQARPRYAGQPGMPGLPPSGVPYGAPPAGPYGMAPQGYPPRPSGPGVRPPSGPVSGANGLPTGPNGRINGGPSPVGVQAGLPAGAIPRGQMPVRPQQGYPQEMQAQAPQGNRLNAQTLARAQPQEQKQMLGEAIYPLIHE